MRTFISQKATSVLCKAWLVLIVLLACTPLHAQQISLNALVTPSTVIEKNGKPIKFAIHAYIEFKSLAEVFPYIQSQNRRWKGKIGDTELRELEKNLLREAIESRVISMEDERPLEALVTHTNGELQAAIANLHTKVPDGYGEAFLAVQGKWKHALNCWSASPSIAGRVLSNWYPIEEGISIYGVTYDTTEHFWQSVKYHPDVTVSDLKTLLAQLEARSWVDWFRRLDDDPKLYLPNAYAVEFLRHNLEPKQIWGFLTKLDAHGLQDSDHARNVQQRGAAPFRFSAYEEKVLWGDLADTLHLVYVLSAADDPIRQKLAAAHFDGIYLGNQKMGFISEEFRLQMLEVFKMKYLQMSRFREVIANIPPEIKLEHFLNDGDSPDIPIPVYVGYLNQVRELARAGTTK
ncbi:MAG TPA: hypothetical protein VMH89_06515 [Candidatus Acidoferrum sp.]|nr:hypothetical protein [Candidatus Acidoferrum sp.]